MSRPVPTEPGWWWRPMWHADGTVLWPTLVERDAVGLHADGYDVARFDWLAPVATPDEVARLRAERDEARAEVERLRVELDTANRRWDRASERWCVYHPEQGLEWFDTRAEADAFAVDLMTDALHDTGEACDDQCSIMAIVASTEEVVGGTSKDDTADGEWCRERGFDYFVSGYTVTPGPGCVLNDSYIERQSQRVSDLEAEVERLRSLVASLERAAGGGGE